MRFALAATYNGTLQNTNVIAGPSNIRGTVVAEDSSGGGIRLAVRAKKSVPRIPEAAVDNPRTVDAEPTKEFFIKFLIKDIELTRAILDLVDNAVDGARRLRSSGRYVGLTIRLELKPEQFRIRDNCGGISVDVARHYAFRFGRPDDMPKTGHSVGQFGVGMKRALFKLGSHFRVESTTRTSRFVIDEDVDKWKKHDRWKFDFQTLEEHGRFGADAVGTTVIVSPLHDPVSEEFRLETFQTRLRREIEAAHQDTMECGLAVTLDGIPLQFRPNELLNSGDLHPAYEEFVPEIYRRNRAVTVKMFAGVGRSAPELAGWNIYCNGRLVLEADQTLTTGWGEGSGKVIPKYHNQFARFRGYVMFDSDDAGLLPWNTTKTGVDTDSALYRAVRQKMTGMMRPVIDFLNKLDAEKDRASTEKPLTAIVNKASPIRLRALSPGRFSFTVKTAKPRGGPEEQRISYYKPTPQIKKVKAALNASTLREIGERTFDYFYSNECED